MLIFHWFLSWFHVFHTSCALAHGFGAWRPPAPAKMSNWKAAWGPGGLHTGSNWPWLAPGGVAWRVQNVYFSLVFMVFSGLYASCAFGVHQKDNKSTTCKNICFTLVFGRFPKEVLVYNCFLYFLYAHVLVSLVLH